MYNNQPAIMAICKAMFASGYATTTAIIASTLSRLGDISTNLFFSPN